ncbi:HlyD family secretion protein [Pseudomonadota bacterium]
MELLLVATYTAICVAIFKIFRIPLNKWTVPTAFLGGVVMIGALLLVMNYNHPYSETTRDYFGTTPIIPQVRGRVLEVPIKSNEPLKAGDVLFRIDPEPYKYEIEGIEARLVAARKEAERAENLYKQGAGSERDLDIAQASVDDLESQLEDAQFDLEQTTVTAPSDGFVTQLILRPGMMALPLGGWPVMTFVHKAPRAVVGWFRQNSLLRLEAGDEAEVALDAVPGVIFKGRVGQLIPAIAEGQLQPGANLRSFSEEKMPGRAAVYIEITDPAFDQYREKLPSGLYGQAAIYTHHFHHLGTLRRVLLRMSGWLNYVFPFH